uniref:protein archease isoform X6 n=1 Tax=Callithrix jacchus TaxID=9483 RepID=UPI0023DCFC0D|nr:protein archease isoform X6 [Callithrix jacchus]
MPSGLMINFGSEREKRTSPLRPGRVSFKIWIIQQMSRDDLQSLLFHFLDEWLYKFSADEFFIPREVKVLSIDQRNFKLRSIGWGEEFSLSKHPQGTEVKAITYSAMQVYNEEKPEVFVIIDI